MAVQEHHRGIVYYTCMSFTDVTKNNDFEDITYRQEFKMFRTILMTTAIMMSAPALAQAADPMQASPATPSQSTQPAEPVAPAQASPATPQGATPSQPANPANSVANIVDTEFPAYDANSDGQLDKAEFGKWMVALKDQEMKATGKTLPADRVMTWANGAFATADKDKSSSVSKPELIAYLSGGAA